MDRCKKRYLQNEEILTDKKYACKNQNRSGKPGCGSGLADNDFRQAVQLGVSKVNIFTDIDKAGKAGVEAGIAAGERTMMGLIPYEIDAMKKVVAEKIRLFGSEGKVR